MEHIYNKKDRYSNVICKNAMKHSNILKLYGEEDFYAADRGLIPCAPANFLIE